MGANQAAGLNRWSMEHSIYHATVQIQVQNGSSRAQFRRVPMIPRLIVDERVHWKLCRIYLAIEVKLSKRRSQLRVFGDLIPVRFYGYGRPVGWFCKL